MVDPINPSTNNSPQNRDLEVFVPFGTYNQDQVTTFDNINWVGVIIITEVLSIPGGTTLTPRIGTVRPISGDFEELAVGTPIAAPGITQLVLHPAVTVVAGEKSSNVAPRRLVFLWENSNLGISDIQFGAGGYLVV